MNDIIEEPITDEFFSEENHINLITVRHLSFPSGGWLITHFTNKGLEYAVEIRKYKYIARYVAEGMATILGASNKLNGWSLELQIYNRRGKLKGKNSKQSYGYDPESSEGWPDPVSPQQQARPIA